MTQTSDSRKTADKLESFLKGYYRDEIGQLAQRYPNDQQSLAVQWMDLYRYDTDLADDYLEKPEVMQTYMNEALRGLDLPIDKALTNAIVRVCGLPDSNTFDVGDYRTSQQGEYLGVNGQVSRRTQVKPKGVELAFECQRCGALSYVPQVEGKQEPHECQGCERQGPFTVNYNQSEFVDFQVLRLQRPPEQASKGGSETVDVNLEGDLAGGVEAGDRVNIDGILEMREEENSNDATFEFYLSAGAVEHKETSYEDIDIQKHIEEIREIANSDDPYGMLVDSFAQQIYGYEDYKLSIILQMFAGVRSEYPDGSADRGSIHILLLGDPGTAKSSLLRAANQLSPRSTFASGKGSSAAGLTAGVKSDDFGQERFSLEAGAMVTANEGLACIDEIDKVDAEVRSSLHTALEQQVVEVSKIIEATMPARTSLLAAGNPKYGRFDQYESIGEQITLDPALMSRFDLMFMISDKPDTDDDTELADHILDMKTHATEYTHREGEEIPEEVEPKIEKEVIRAYIAYARQYVFPTFEDRFVKERLRDFYVSLREKGMDDDSPVPVTARKLEAGARLAEASARVRLSQTIEKQDVERAKKLIMESLTDVGIDPETGELDADVVETGESRSQRQRKKQIKAILVELEEEHEDGAPKELALDLAEERGYERDKAEYEIEELRKQGAIYAAAAKDHFKVT